LSLPPAQEASRVSITVGACETRWLREPWRGGCSVSSQGKPTASVSPMRTRDPCLNGTGTGGDPNQRQQEEAGVRPVRWNARRSHLQIQSFDSMDGVDSTVWILLARRRVAFVLPRRRSACLFLSFCLLFENERQEWSIDDARARVGDAAPARPDFSFSLEKRELLSKKINACD
jgi:hypothetical protein